MRRILVEAARRKQREKHGGDRQRIALDAAQPAAPDARHDLVALDAALTRLEAEDPQMGYLREQVNFALTKYNSLLDRIEGARLELDSARAAFKYRYTVLSPVQRPRGPMKPKPKLVLSASVVAGLALAILSAAFLDLRSRKFLESWQVERALKVPLLGEIRRT